MSSTAPNFEEWLTLIEGPKQQGVWVVHQEERHLVVVASQFGIRAWCTCGWDGPDRNDDPHAVALVVDDCSQHLHHVRLACPEHEPPRWVCRVCEGAGR